MLISYATPDNCNPVKCTISGCASFHCFFKSKITSFKTNSILVFYHGIGINSYVNLNLIPSFSSVLFSCCASTSWPPTTKIIAILILLFFIKSIFLVFAFLIVISNAFLFFCNSIILLFFHYQIFLDHLLNKILYILMTYLDLLLIMENYILNLF